MMTGGCGEVSAWFVNFFERMVQGPQLSGSLHLRCVEMSLSMPSLLKTWFFFKLQSIWFYRDKVRERK
jgi:hypothetical protein